MKKMLSILTACTLSVTSATAVVACGTGNELRIVFVPTSTDPVSLLATVDDLKGILEDEMKKVSESHGRVWDKEVKISVSTDQSKAGISIKNGNSDIGFLPTGTYVTNRGEMTTDGVYSDIGVLVTSSRQAIKPEYDVFLITSSRQAIKPEYDVFLNSEGKFDNDLASAKKDIEKTLNLTNSYNEYVADLETQHKNDSTHDYDKDMLNTPEDAKATYYRSYMYATNETYQKVFADTDGDKNISSTEYKTNLKQTILDPNIDIGMSTGKTSSSGLLYPLVWMQDELGFTDTELQTVFKKRLDKGSANDAVEKVSNGTFDLVVGYSDIRFQNVDVAKQNQYIQNVKVVGMAGAIINDGINYSRKTMKDPNEIADLREAFINLVNDPANEEIFGIYNQSAYIAPSTIADEKVVDEAFTDSFKPAQAMQEKIKNW